MKVTGAEVRREFCSKGRWQAGNAYVAVRLVYASVGENVAIRTSTSMER